MRDVSARLERLVGAPPAEVGRALMDAARRLADHGEAARAYPLFERHDRLDLGVQFAEASGDFRQAAHWAERAGAWARAAELRQRAREPLLAAALYERAGAIEAAARAYEDSAAHERAAALWERAGDRRRAAEAWLRAMTHNGHGASPTEAAEACRHAGRLFAELGDIDHAVRVLRWGGEHGVAARLLARYGRYGDAVRLFEEIGDLVSAAEVARVSGDVRHHHELLARRAEQDGRLLEAAAHYEEAGDAFSAIRVYELAGAPDRAARAAEQGELWDSAAQLHERLGDYDRAAACLRAAGREADAASVLRRAESREVSIQAQAAQAEYFGAAVAVLARARRGERERYREAVDFLRRVSRDHPDYMAARTMLGEVLAEMGEVPAALAALQELFVGVAPDARFVPAMYQYGRLLEREGYFAGARNAYRTVASFDPSYRDVELRLGRLRETDRPSPGGEVTGRPGPTPRGVPVVIAGPRPPDPPARSDEAGGRVPVLTQDLLLPEPALTPSPIRSDDVGRGPAPGASSQPPPLPREGAGGEAPDPRVGIVLRDRFRLERRIGRGAQATVYLARDQVLDREVAIKVLAHDVDDSDETLARFLREARLAARVHHPSCVAIFDFGRERGTTFIAMEYFRGRTIRDLLRKGPLDPYLALRIGRDVASALAAVHAAGIVHRDVKPTNIMVDRSARVRLTDFGVARFATDDSANGMMVGTMKYMAPEQARGQDADRRADIFSLGVVIWEMLVGRAPFGGTLDALIARVSKPPPELPADVSVPNEVRVLLRRAMQRRPEQRFAAVEPFLDALNLGIAQVRAARSGARSAASDPPSTGGAPVAPSREKSRG
jgi:serine/threonine-protein kinase